MHISSKLTLALVSLAIALPAAAQRLPVGGSSTNKKAPDGALPQESAATQTETTAATSTTGRKFAVSKAAQKPIIDLQKAVEANDVANIPTLLAAAQKVAKSSDEKYLVAAAQTRAAMAAGDTVAIKAGIAALEASGGAETADLAARYTDLGKRFQKAKQVDEAAAAFNRALALDANNLAAMTLLAGVRSDQGQKAEAVALMQKSFAASKASGKKVEEGNYKFAAGLAYAQRLPIANDIAREWVTVYPSPVSWRDTLRIYRDLNKPEPGKLIDVLRLARAARALSGEGDYFSLGNALVSAGKLAEAKSVLAEARTAPNVDATKRAFTDLNARLASAPTRAAIDASAKAALAGGTAKAMLDAGDALYGVGAYAEAAPLYRAALAKGADAGLANLHLGMALARAGDKAGATAALNAVTGVNADVARYWLLWLSTQA